MNESGMKNRVSLARVVGAIARVTFWEILREKVLYNILVAAFLLFGVGFLASKFTFIQPERVVLDFGLSALNISSLALATLVGAGLLGKEFDRRTVYVALSHPISAFHFVLGKYWGLVQVLVVNWLLLALVYGLMLFGQSGAAMVDQVGFTFGAALWLALIQSFVMGGVAVLFSSFSTTSLSVILSVGLYLVGVNHAELRILATRMQSELGKMVLNGVTTFLPNFGYFNLGTKLTYDLPVSGQMVATSTLYGVMMVGASLLISGLLVKSRAS